LLIGSAKVALGKAQVIDGIEQTGFTHPVGTTNTHHLPVKVDLVVCVVFEL
jgi:hypothetical protein